MKKFISVILFVAILTALCFTVYGCTHTPDDTPVTEKSVLRQSGNKIVDGEGNEVVLRGVNVGGISAIEPWMNGFTKSYQEGSDIVCKDSATIFRVFVERFGVTKTKEIIKKYQETWFNDYDFQNCVDMGINVLRLPFTYMDLDFSAVLDLNEGGKSYDFTFLDDFIAKAKDYGLYVILDMHGAYGSQNGKDHSGEVFSAGKVDFYSNEQKITLTCNLWKAIAERYKDEPTVAGYDVLNEPAETTGNGTLTTTTRHFIVFDRIYKAIRSVDSNHMVIFESCWEADNLPLPSEYGWENCMYSFHHYTGTDDFNAHTSSFNARIEQLVNKNFGVPILMGEFTCYNNSDSWDYTLALMNAQGVSWTSWTYKVNATSVMPWGIYNIKVESENKINAHADSYEVILEKIAKLSTKDYASAYKFSDNKGLASIIQKHSSDEKHVDFLPGNYYIRSSDYLALKVNSASTGVFSTVIKGEDKWDGNIFLLSRYGEENKSVYLKTNGKYLSVKQVGGVDTLVLSDSQSDEARFLITETEYGYKILSYSSRKYLRYDDDKQVFVADATYTSAEDFFTEKN